MIPSLRPASQARAAGALLHLQPSSMFGAGLRGGRHQLVSLLLTVRELSTRRKLSVSRRAIVGSP
jgi:hypothetical protein